MFKENNTLYRLRTEIQESDSTATGDDNDIPENWIVTRFSHLDILFNRKWKKVGVNLSGGADSSLLTYFICKIIQDNNLDCTVDIVTFTRCWETRPWQGWWSIQVLNKLKDKFPNIIKERHTTFIPTILEHGVTGPLVEPEYEGRSGDQIIVGEFNKYISDKQNFCALFNGTSKNPDDSRQDRMKNRDGNALDGELFDLMHYRRRSGTWVMLPFKFVKKDWIVAQYHLYNIIDLYYTTRSCEGDIDTIPGIQDIELFKYTEGMAVPTCNTCWWCGERQWAESRVESIIKEIKNI